MKNARKALIFGPMLALSSMAFSQTTQTPASPAQGTGAAATTSPSNVRPLNAPTNPSNNMPLDTQAQTLAPPPGPAVSDRDKVSCPPGQELIAQGSRMMCVTRSAQAPREPMQPDMQPQNPQQKNNVINF